MLPIWHKILHSLLRLKSFINDNLPNYKVILSTPTLRTDDGKSALTVNQLTNHLLQLDIDITDNRSINSRNLGNKGLHLNPTGTSRLAKNLLSSINFFLKSMSRYHKWKQYWTWASFSIWFWNAHLNTQ